MDVGNMTGRWNNSRISQGNPQSIRFGDGTLPRNSSTTLFSLQQTPLSNNSAALTSLADTQIRRIMQPADNYGTASATNSDGMAGIIKRTANTLTFNTAFPTTLTSYQQGDLSNQVRSLYGGDNPIQNAADIDAYSEKPFFGSKTLKHGDIFTTTEIVSAAVGGIQALKSAPKLVSAVQNLGNKDVQIWGFRGGRGELEARVLDNPDPHVRAEAYTGHVGISLDKGKTIHGFGPQVPANETKRDVIVKLKDNQTYPGIITDDTTLFRDVRAGKYDPSNAPPIDLYVMNVKTPSYVVSRLNSTISQGEITGVRYGFPTATHPVNIVRNCATAFGECGLTLPSSDGKLINYVPAMQEHGAIKVK